MTAPVAHINLLQRAAPKHTTAWALAAITTLTVIGAAVYGGHLRGQVNAAALQREESARQLKQVQAELAAANGEQARTAKAKALRDEVDALTPQAQAAQALTEAVHGPEARRSAGFTQALLAMTGVSEPGLWLNAMTISSSGKRLELQGEAGNGAAVLRYARHANQSLAPLAIRLENLEILPAAGVATAGVVVAPAAGTVAFKLN